MKRTAAFITLLSCLLFLSNCGAVRKTKTGHVSTYCSAPACMELFVEEESTGYGIVITDSTKIVWENEAQELSVGDEVTVVLGKETESADDSVDQCVARWYVAKKITVHKSAEPLVAAKPVIYLYPEREQEVQVQLDYNGELTCTYPAYNGGWKVTARPDGTLIDAAGQTYSYLYWEGETAGEYDFSQGFCVAGKDTAAFLENALARQGLNRKEANEFIVYWLPLMEKNSYNLIAFQGERYTENARLTVAPEPDTVLRVFMAWKPLETPVEIEPQPLAAPQRNGFTLVEWGGTKVY